MGPTAGIVLALICMSLGSYIVGYQHGRDS
jgi:hypothetical protein